MIAGQIVAIVIEAGVGDKFLNKHKALRQSRARTGARHVIRIFLAWDLLTLALKNSALSRQKWVHAMEECLIIVWL